LEGFSCSFSAKLVKSTKDGEVWAFYDDTNIYQNGPKSDAWVAWGSSRDNLAIPSV
jgi:hypothetical protein